MSRGFIFGQILTLGACLLLCVSGAMGADTSAAEPSASGDTCEGLAEKAIESLRSSGVLSGGQLCTDDSCQAVSEVTDAITKLSTIADKITDATKKTAFVKLITSISDAKKSILDNFPSPLPSFDPNGEGQKALIKVQAVKILCNAAQDAIKATMDDAAANVSAQAKINVCRDKARRLPAFLARYYGVAGSAAGGGEPVLDIAHARYGDIYDEDLDYRRSLVDKIGGYPEVGYPIDPAVPRAGKVFSEPELDNVSEPPWGSHRHTCDVTFKIRSLCAQRGCKSGVCSGDAYCILGVGAADPTTAAPFVGCGYDPAPWYPKKSLQIEFTCDGRTPQRLIYPGNTTSIGLICSEPPNDMTAERDYFANDPCKIDLPAPAAVTAANTETDKKADSQKSDTDKKPAGKTDAPTPAPAPAGSAPGGHQ